MSARPARGSSKAAGESLRLCRARTAVAWRRWLERHHDTAREVWLVFHKKHTGEASVAYEDAVDEALCFGWIDSLVMRLDVDRYVRKFTPRKATSGWSAINRRRYARLESAGRLTPAGMARSPRGRPDAALPPAPATLPGHMRRALAAHPAARRAFDALPPSHRRRYLQWIESAKRDETKARRVREAIARLEAGQALAPK